MSWEWILTALLIVGYLIAAPAVIHALLRTRHPQSALGWVAAIIILPFAGSIAYFIFGINRVDSLAARLMSDTAAKRRQYLREMTQKSYNLVPPTHYLPEEYDIVRVGEKKPNSLFRAGGHQINPLFNGDEAYPPMIQAINDARREVFLCTYIFEGKVWGEAFADALLAAHRRGVDVRVLVDGLGTFLPRSKPWKRLRKQGVPVGRFIPPRLIPPQVSINLRNHRKVLVCDDWGFTGGMNISDGHVLASSEKYHVQDLHFSCNGPVVQGMREAFLLDWAFVTGQKDASAGSSPAAAGEMDCRLILDGPGTAHEPLLDLICGVISCAKKRIIVFTPYFLPPREMISAFISADARGVDVRVILPKELDHRYVEWASNRTILPLLEGGVRIFRQPKPFAHTKLLLVDDMYVCLGSVNLDPRSLRLNFELNLEVFSHAFNARLSKYADSVLARSEEVTLADMRQLSLPLRLRNAGAWIFSPYM